MHLLKSLILSHVPLTPFPLLPTESTKTSLLRSQMSSLKSSACSERTDGLSTSSSWNTPSDRGKPERVSLYQEAQASLPLPSVSAPKNLGIDTFWGKQIIFKWVTIASYSGTPCKSSLSAIRN